MQLSWSAAALALLAAAPIAAQNAVDFAPDITARLGAVTPLDVADENLAHDDAAGGVSGFLIPAGTLPANVEIAAYHPLAAGTTWLSLDTTTALPGLPLGAPAEPRDVVLFDPSTGLFSMVFDGSVVGVPANARIDAVTANAALDPELSFDTTVALPGLGAVDDEDVVVYAGGAFAMAFDGSAAGVASALDLDGAHEVAGAPALLVSFDASGTVGGVGFDDEDVLLYDLGLGTYTMYFDGSVSDPFGWPRADLAALPEPARALGLAAGAAMLVALARRRAGAR